MNRSASGKAAIRKAGISFNVVKKTPRAQAKTAVGIDSNVVKSIRSAWRAIEAQFNSRPGRSVHIEDLLKRGLGANVTAGRQREYLAALHSELMSRRKFQAVAVETKGGIGLLWRLKSQVPSPSSAGPPAADPRYNGVTLTPHADRELASLRETIRENDSVRRPGSYVCALDYQRLMTGILPIRRRDRSLFPSKPNPAEIILHPDRDLAGSKEISGWIDGKAACIYGLANLFRELPIVVGSRVELARMRLEGHYRLSIDLDATDSQPPQELEQRAVTSLRAVACALTAGGTPLPFRRLHRLATHHRAMPPETLAAVISDWPCFPPVELAEGATGWRFDPSQLSSGRRSVRTARLAFEQSLSDLDHRTDALTESIESIFKQTQFHRQELASILASGDQISQSGGRNSQR